MKTLRLLLFSECNRGCPGCCNKDWDLNNLPICSDFNNYDEIILTGGEPLLHPDIVKDTIQEIRSKNPNTKLYMYTANTSIYDIYDLFVLLDGITVTLHENSDVAPFLNFVNHISISPFKELEKSLRLNIFKGVELFESLDSGEMTDLKRWQIKDNIEWIKHCPLPDNEVFMRLDKNKVVNKYRM